MEELPEVLSPAQRRELTALYLRVSAEMESRAVLTFDEMVAAIVRFHTNENCTLEETIIHIIQGAAFCEAEGREEYERAKEAAYPLARDWFLLPSQ